MLIRAELRNISLKTAITTFNNYYLGIQFYTVIYSNYSISCKRFIVLLKS